MTRPPEGLLPRNSRRCVHFLNQAQRPAVIACATPVAGGTVRAWTADKDAITCQDCWRFAHPTTPYQGERK